MFKLFVVVFAAMLAVVVAGPAYYPSSYSSPDVSSSYGNVGYGNAGFSDAAAGYASPSAYGGSAGYQSPVAYSPQQYQSYPSY